MSEPLPTTNDSASSNGSAPNGSSSSKPSKSSAPPLTSRTQLSDDRTFDLVRRRDQLNAKVAELQWDLGGMVYEMAVRDQIRTDVIVKRAADLQAADAELQEVERILRLEETSVAGACGNCGSPHSTGASFCWQCGQPLLAEVSSASISADAR